MHRLFSNSSALTLKNYRASAKLASVLVFDVEIQASKF